jgi:adenylate kinase
MLSHQLNVPYITAQFFGGTSLLIIVGVILDTMRQVETHLIQRHYDGFLRKGKIRGRRTGLHWHVVRLCSKVRCSGFTSPLPSSSLRAWQFSSRAVFNSEAADRVARTSSFGEGDPGGTDSSGVRSAGDISGAILREEKRKGTPLGLRADELTSRGELVPDEMVIEVARAWLSENDGSFIFDGFPRTIGQGEALTSLLEERRTPLDAVFLMEADIDTLRRRVQQRLVCTKCGRIVSEGLHIASASQGCPTCGGELGRRADDTLATLERRMEQYTAKTVPLIDYYQSQGLLHRIDTTRTPDLVFKSVAEVMEAP